MDTGTIIACVAIAFALLGLTRTQSLKERAKALEEQLGQVRALLSERPKEVASADAVPSKGVGGSMSEDERRHVSALESSIQVLELRAQEHDALLCAVVTEDEARHLWNVSRGEATSYELHQTTESELRSLVRRGLIRKKGEFKIHELPHSFDLVEQFEITDTGSILLDLRKALEESDHKPATSLPPRTGNS